MVKLSVVTVCYEAAEDLKSTLDSVLAQTSNDYEYVIQDGASADRTKEVAQEYRDKFSEIGVPLYFYSEPDNGIYDAMNQATIKCSGEWLLFLNAGDCLAEVNVLSRIWEQDIPEDAVILYGDTVEMEQDGNYLWRGNLDELNVRCSLCHQSVLIRREWMIKNPYDLDYRIASDYDFFLKTREQKRKFYRIDLIVSRITKNGISNQHEKERVLETEKVKEKYGLGSRHSLHYIYIYAQATVKQWMIDTLSDTCVQKVRRWRRKLRKRGIKLENKQL